MTSALNTTDMEMMAIIQPMGSFCANLSALLASTAGAAPANMAAIIVVFFIILERQVVVLLGGIFDTLVVKLFKGTNHTETGVAWFDDIVDVTLVGGIVWIAEELLPEPITAISAEGQA